MTAGTFDSIYCNGKVYNNDNKDVHIIGTIKEPILENEIHYFAASPPDFHATYTGSALPFANQIQAFENTPNIGKAPIQNGRFEVKITYPNSYMVGLGTVLVPPTLFIRYFTLSGEQRYVNIKISHGIPYRNLTYPNLRHDAMFYNNHHCLPVRTQEQILRDSEYPPVNAMPKNHWGLKPAQ
jgi:hypothetical protein